MKIAHLSPSFFPSTRYGGPPRALHRLCQSLAAGGDQVRVLTTNADGPEHTLNVTTGQECEGEPRLSVYYARRQWPESISWDLLRRLGEWIRWADVVHLTAVYSFPTWPTLALCRRWNKPLVWSPRGAFERWKGSRRVFQKALFDRVSRVLMPPRVRLHVTSERESRLSAVCMPGAEATVIGNGVDGAGPLHRTARTGPMRLLFLGRLDPKKGIENLLRGCAALPKSLAWTLQIAGDGEVRYNNSLRALGQELQLGTRIQWLGVVEGQAKEKCFQEADWLIAPSYTENFCQVVAEALTRGVPVIASEGTPWEQVREVGCGLWVPNSPEALTRAILEASRMPAEAMGARGWQWMERDFRWESVARKMHDAYAALAGSPPQ